MGKAHPWRWPVGFLLRRSGRERVSTRKLGDLCASALSLQDNPMPSRMTQEAIGQESPIGPWLATLQPTLLTSFREPDGAVMTADMKLQGWERRIGAPSLRGLQGRSATNQNDQAAKERMSCGLDAARIFLASGSGRSVFLLDIPFIGLPGTVGAITLERCQPAGIYFVACLSYCTVSVNCCMCVKLLDAAVTVRV